jgi:hypothetical protein
MRRVCFFVLLVSLLGGLRQPSWAAVAFDAVANSSCIAATCTSGGTVLTYSHTTGSGSNRGLAVGVCVSGPGATTQPVTNSVTYAGVSLVSKKKQGTTYYCELWSLPDGTQPTTGANNVVVTLASAPSGTNAILLSAAVTFTGVNQSTAWTSSSNGNGGTGTSVTLTLSANNAVDMGVDFACHGFGFSSTTETSRVNNTDSGAACNSFGVATAAGSDTSLSWTSASSDSWLIVGGSLNGGTSAAVVVPRRALLFQ